MEQSQVLLENKVGIDGAQENMPIILENAIGKVEDKSAANVDTKATEVPEEKIITVQENKASDNGN